MKDFIFERQEEIIGKIKEKLKEMIKGKIKKNNWKK